MYLGMGLLLVHYLSKIYNCTLAQFTTTHMYIASTEALSAPVIQLVFTQYENFVNYGRVLLPFNVKVVVVRSGTINGR